MANIITGTEGIDTLQGTTSDDDIKALGGDDRIIGSLANDAIDGGAGIDTVDYSGTSASSFVNFSKDGTLQVFRSNRKLDGNPDRLGEDKLTNVETIIASKSPSSNPLDYRNTIEVPTAPRGQYNQPLGPLSDISMDVDLATNRVTYSSPSTGITKTFNVIGFQNIFGGDTGKDRLGGDDGDNLIAVRDAGGTIVGSKGNDRLSDARYGKSATIDYTNLDTDLKISGAWRFSPRVYRDPDRAYADIAIKKGSFGTDRLNFNENENSYGQPITGNSQTFIGAANKENTFDASGRDKIGSIVNEGKFNVNLANNSLNIGFKNTDFSINYQLVNFKNFIGGKLDDTIVGGNNGGRLTGSGGSDTITGGSGNDVIIGASAGSRGVGEVDTLTGGGGKDKFFIGNANGAYYVGNGASDYALITDFNLFEDSLSIGNITDYSVASMGNNSIELYGGKDPNTRDLIAKIQLSTPLGSQAKTTNKGILAANSFLVDSVVDPLSSQLQIVSGDNGDATI